MGISWLSGWTCRKKIIIDKTYVGSALSDYTIPLYISDNCGANNYNLSDMLSNLEYPIEDYFDGVNGSFPNDILWIPSGGNEPTIQNNKLRMVQTQWLEGNFIVQGDFDAEMQFTVQSGPSTNSWVIKFPFYQFHSPYYTTQMSYGYASSQFRFKAEDIETPTQHGLAAVSEQTSAKMRVTRSGSTWSYYYDIGAGWVLLGSASSANGTADVSGWLEVQVWSPTTNASVDIDYFKYNSIDPLFHWSFDPYGKGYYPTRKKIALTSSDGKTELPVEIDYYAEKDNANYYVKASSLSDTVDSVFYLYYDFDHADNSNIYDTWDASANTVWDSNYVGIWHLSQMIDSDWGYTSYLDSKNTNDASVSNINFSNSLTDGLFGRSVDINGPGNDAVINCGNDSSLNNLSTKTIEIVFYANNFNGCLIQKSNNKGNGWALYTNATNNKLIFTQSFNSGSTIAQWESPTSSISTGQWTYVSITYDDSNIANDPIIYIGEFNSDSSLNSVTVTETVTPISSVDSDSSNNLYIGSMYNSGSIIDEFDGFIDEVRISNNIRSSDWLSLTYSLYRDDVISYYTDIRKALVGWIGFSIPIFVQLQGIIYLQGGNKLNSLSSLNTDKNLNSLNGLYQYKELTTYIDYLQKAYTLNVLWKIVQPIDVVLESSITLGETIAKQFNVINELVVSKEIQSISSLNTDRNLNCINVLITETIKNFQSLNELVLSKYINIKNDLSISKILNSINLLGTITSENIQSLNGLNIDKNLQGIIGLNTDKNLSLINSLVTITSKTIQSLNGLNIDKNLQGIISLEIKKTIQITNALVIEIKKTIQSLNGLNIDKNLQGIIGVKLTNSLTSINALVTEVDKTIQSLNGLNIDKNLQVIIQKELSKNIEISNSLITEVDKTIQSLNSFVVSNSVNLPYDFSKVDKILEINTLFGQKVDKILQGINELSLYNFASTTLRSVNNLESATIEVVDANAYAIKNSKVMEIISVSVESNDDSYCLSFQADLKNIEDWSLCVPGSYIDIVISTDTFKMIIDSRNRDIAFNSESYNIQGRSITAKLDEGYASQITTTYSATTARTIVNDLCVLYGINYEYNIVDWSIPSNVFEVESYFPIQIIGEIVEAAGGIVQTKADGTLVLMQKYPVPPTLYDSNVPDMFIRGEDFYSLSQNKEIKPKWNAVNVYDFDTTDAISYSIQLLEMNTATDTATIIIIAYPFISDMTGMLKTSHFPSGVDIEYLGVEYEEQEEEVEIVNAEGSVAYPIYNVVSYNYGLSTNLGAISYDGTKITVNEGHSMLYITYNTQWHKYEIKNTNKDLLQIYLEEN